AETRRADPEVHAPDRAVRRVDGNPADTERLVEVAVRRDVAAATLDLDLQLETRLFVQSRDVDVRIDDLDLRIIGHVLGGHLARTRDVDRQNLGVFAVEPDRHLLQVQDDVGDVFDHSRYRGELVEHSFDVDRGDRRPLDRGEQTTA